MFIGFQLLYCSIAERHECQVAVIDLGMTLSQRDWCRKQKNLMVIEPRLTHMMKFVHTYNWQKWNKPYYFLLSPFERTLWLDADTMVLFDIDKLFTSLETGPFLCSTCRPIQDEWMFQRMPHHVSLPNYACYPSTAVIGIDCQRDFWLVRDWMWAVENISEKVKMNCPGYDYDMRALAWSLGVNNAFNIVSENMAWNWTVKALQGTDVTYTTPSELLLSVKTDFPVACIIHWEGALKPWLFWRGEHVLDMTPHREMK